jgi:hypothetical protein
MTYQTPVAHETFGLCDGIARELPVRLRLYDNTAPPALTSPTSSAPESPLAEDCSIKAPGALNGPGTVRERIEVLRAVTPDSVTIGLGADSGGGGRTERRMRCVVLKSLGATLRRPR